MNKTIGEIKNASGKTLIKMWDGNAPGGTRPFRRHLHSAFEIAYIKKGEGVYTLKDGNIAFGAYDCIADSNYHIFINNTPSGDGKFL